MATIRYLAYGSNLHPERLRRRTSSAVLLTTWELTGWRLSFDKRGFDGSAKATIAATDDDRDLVHAAIFELSLDEKPALDRIEGVNRGYHAHVLSLPDLGEVHTYKADTEFQDGSLVPFRWYRDLVLHGARFHGFPRAYVDDIAAVPVIEDSDDARQREHDDILAAMRRAMAEAAGDPTTDNPTTDNPTTDDPATEKE